MKTKVAICIPGILSKPEDSDGWTDRAVTWFHTHTKIKAEKFEYFAGPLTRRFKLGKVSRGLADLIVQYKDCEIYLLCHSNGGEVVTRTIQSLLIDHPSSRAKIKSVHLFAPANSADFAKNWFNIALISKTVEHFFVYRGHDDKALQLGRLSRRLFGWMGLGYGDLGLVGPQNVDHRYTQRVVDHPDFAEGHSGFFTESQFCATMQTVIENISAK